MAFPRPFVLSLAAACSILAASSARANLIDLQAVWSGIYYGNNASAVATFTLDDSLFINPGYTTSLPVTNLQLTVTGASLGDGTFDQSYFSNVVLDLPNWALDFTQELVGQDTGFGFWGFNDGFPFGDFNLLSIAGAPTGTDHFTLTTASGLGDPMELTSLAPYTPPVPPVPPAAVPETSAWVMGFLALGAVMLVIRRRAGAVA